MNPVPVILKYWVLPPDFYVCLQNVPTETTKVSFWFPFCIFFIIYLENDESNNGDWETISQLGLFSSCSGAFDQLEWSPSAGEACPVVSRDDCSPQQRFCLHVSQQFPLRPGFCAINPVQRPTEAECQVSVLFHLEHLTFPVWFCFEMRRNLGLKNVQTWSLLA